VESGTNRQRKTSQTGLERSLIIFGHSGRSNSHAQHYNAPAIRVAIVISGVRMSAARIHESQTPESEMPMKEN
jgi:hypothetical protein